MARKPFSPQTAKNLRKRLDNSGMFEPIVTGIAVDYFDNWRKKFAGDTEMLATIEQDEKLYLDWLRRIRKTKLDILRLNFGESDDIEGWKALAFTLAYQLYPGFDAVEKPAKPPKNKKWSIDDQFLLLSRVAEEMKKDGALLKTAIGSVATKYAADYGQFTDITLQARYHEFVGKFEKKWEEVKQGQGTIWEKLMSPYQAWKIGVLDSKLQEAREAEPLDLSSVPAINDTRH